MPHDPLSLTCHPRPCRPCSTRSTSTRSRTAHLAVGSTATRAASGPSSTAATSLSAAAQTGPSASGASKRESRRTSSGATRAPSYVRRLLACRSQAAGCQADLRSRSAASQRCLQIVEPVRQPNGEFLPPYPLVVTGSRDSTIRVWRLPGKGEPEFRPMDGDKGSNVRPPLSVSEPCFLSVISIAEAFPFCFLALPLAPPGRPGPAARESVPQPLP
jgi:WD40 repeat protein